MSRSVKPTMLVLVLAASFAAATPGCASKNKSREGKKPQTKPSAAAAAKDAAAEAGDDDFQRGASRPPTPKTLYALAQILQTQGKDDQAEPVLMRVIADEPRFMAAYCDLAELRMRQRRIEEAYNVLSAGLKVVPDEPILLNNRGMCQVLLKDYEGALANFTRAAAVRPDDARYRSNMAMTLALMGRYDESYSLYVLVMTPKDARENLATLAEANGDHDRAEQFRQGKKTIAKAQPSAPAVALAPAPATQPAAAIVAVPATQPAVVIVATPATQPARGTEMVNYEIEGDMNSESSGL